MREILFRGKRTDNGKWVEGCLDFNKDKSLVYIRTPSSIYTDVNMVSIATVGQYTGLTDKNGKKIFEGDILEHHIQGEIIVTRGVVFWDNENARWAQRLNTMNPCFAIYNPNAYEVIGNIHDKLEISEG